MIKTDITFIYSFGYRELSFTKEFKLPCSPFFGLSILDEDDDNEMNIDIISNDYQTTSITWMVSTQTFEVVIRKNWAKNGVSLETVKDIIRIFNELGWKQLHSDEEKEEMINWVKNNNK